MSHSEVVIIDDHEVRVMELSDSTVAGVCTCGVTAVSSSLTNVERMIARKHKDK